MPISRDLPSRRAALPWHWRRLVWIGAGLTIGLGFLLVVVARPSASQSGAALRAAAEKALRAGQYDEVERLTQEAGADEGLVALRARALIARGEYAQAEELLRAPAASAPASDAALELGLLQWRLGRRSEARRTLQLLLLADTPTGTAADYSRAARAARALGRFEDANGYFREAIAVAPNDAVVNTRGASCSWRSTTARTPRSPSRRR